MTPPRSDHDLLAALETENAQLRGALASRIVIEQAKGAISARSDVTPDEAFEMLRRLARSSRLNIHVLAARVVANRGRLDAEAPVPAARLRSTPGSFGTSSAIAVDVD